MTNAEVVTDLKGKRVAVIRTSDRNTFRSCRRKWNWSSHLRGNLGAKQQASPLWFGSGFHFAMEDYHGYRRFEDPKDALAAFSNATQKYNRTSLPDDWQDLLAMGYAMLDYYRKWEKARSYSLLPTFWFEDKPQLEVNFRIKLPLDQKMLESFGYDEAIYSGTIDRVVYDEKTDMLWLMDFKSAKVFNTQHFQLDSQVTTYCWAASHLYGKTVAGMIYAQHLKSLIPEVRVLKNGHMSTAQNQTVSSITYREKINEVYKSLEAAPSDVQNYLITLEKSEDERCDRFIRHDYLQRSERMQAAEGAKILMEATDMLNPDLPLYPNPTYQCTNMCSFNSACVSMDDGGHYQDELDLNFQQRPASYDGWRKHIIWPGQETKTAWIDWDDI